MKQVVKVRLYPSGEQAALLLKVLELSNQVANHISTVRFTKDIRKKQDLQRATYKEVSDWAAVWISDSGLMGFLMLPVLVVGNCSGRRWGIDN